MHINRYHSFLPPWCSPVVSNLWRTAHLLWQQGKAAKNPLRAMIYPSFVRRLDRRPFLVFGASRKQQSAFTLVETALALGIAAFALVPVVGLLPVGLQASRQASDLTISAQIAQRLVGMVQQANHLKTDASGYTALTGTYYYFDADGQPVSSAVGIPITAVYSASILIPSQDAPTSLVDSANINTLNIQVVNDSEHRLQGTPSATLPAYLQSRATILPIYLANYRS